MNDGFVGMTEYVMKSFHDLLGGESESPSKSDSSRGSHHPSHECFMVGTLEGYIESIHEGEATPTNNLNDEVEADAGPPPRLWVEQLKAQHQELKEARLQLEQERAELEREIERHGDGGRARAMARDVNQRIIEDDGALPHFARASQNITAIAALLCGLPEPATPEDQWAHHKIRMLLEHAVVQ